jgi:very-short-patch-repair endonuclease
MRGLDDTRPGPPWLYGVAARRALLKAGVGKRAIEHRLHSGRYLPVYEGVYAIGHADLTVLGRRRAIVLACGEGAVLSHRSAAGAWGLRPDGGTRWDVTVPSARTPDVPVTTYRHRLAPDEVVDLDAIPTTTVARTLLDLAPLVPPHHLRRAIERAEQLELFDLTRLHQTLDAHPRRAGRRRLIALLDELQDHDLPHTRSDVEAAFLQLCVDHGLPRPRVNHRDGGTERDFTWPQHHLVVEIDGWTYHRTRTAFATDRRRDREVLAQGYRVARFTATEVLRAPAAVAADVRALLAP